MRQVATVIQVRPVEAFERAMVDVEPTGDWGPLVGLLLIVGYLGLFVWAVCEAVSFLASVAR